MPSRVRLSASVAFGPLGRSKTHVVHHLLLTRHDPVDGDHDMVRRESDPDVANQRNAVTRVSMRTIDVPGDKRRRQTIRCFAFRLRLPSAH